MSFLGLDITGVSSRGRYEVPEYFPVGYTSNHTAGPTFEHPDSWYLYSFTTGMLWWKKKHVRLSRGTVKLTLLTDVEETALLRGLEEALEYHETVVDKDLKEKKAKELEELHWKNK